VTERPLLPTSDEDVARDVAYALRDAPLKVSRADASDLRQREAAKIVAHLRLCGLVFLRKAPDWR
jgi:hypothetical protein